MLSCVVISDSSNRLSVPTFYAPPSQNDDLAVWIGSIVGILFGGIHCIAWFFPFPSIIEEYIWRASAVAITAIPVFFFIEFLINKRISDKSRFKGLFKLFQHSMAFFCIVVYLVARIALLVVPFLVLRSLPPGSLSAIKWSSFIPHI